VRSRTGSAHMRLRACHRCSNINIARRIDACPAWRHLGLTANQPLNRAEVSVLSSQCVAKWVGTRLLYYSYSTLLYYYYIRLIFNIILDHFISHTISHTIHYIL